MNIVFQEALDYLRGMWRRRLVGIAASWLVALSGLVALAVAPDKYEASARVFVDTQSVLKPLMSGLAVQPNVEQQVRMLSRTLLSRPNLDKLIRMADLDLDVKTPEQREALIERLLKHLTISVSPGGDNLYTIKYVDVNTARAKRVVDSLLTIFVESGLGGNRRDTQKAQQFIEQQIAEYERKLQESERRLKDFKLRNLEQMGGSNAVEAISAIESQLKGVRVELRAATQSRDALKRQLEGEQPTINTSPGGDASPADVSLTPEIDARLTQLRTKLDELLTNFTDQHPDVMNVRRQIAELERERRRIIDQKAKDPVAVRAAATERNPVYQQLKVSLADAEANAAALKGKADELQRNMEEIRARARMRPELEEELVQLNRDYDVQKSNYDNLIARRESAMMTGQLEQTASVADFRIVDPPMVSNKPVAPNRILLLAAVVAVSVAAGAFASLAYSQLFPVFHSLKGLRKAFPRPVLGALSIQDNPLATKRRRVTNLVFFGGLAGLMAAFASALVFLMFVVRAG